MSCALNRDNTLTYNQEPFPLDRTKLVFLSAFGIAAMGLRAEPAAWAWGNQGHEIVAIIAADNRSPAARDHVAKILGTASDVDSIEKGHGCASIRPDTDSRFLATAGNVGEIHISPCHAPK
jgi:hypothetical protein